MLPTTTTIIIQRTEINVILLLALAGFGIISKMERNYKKGKKDILFVFLVVHNSYIPTYLPTTYTI